MAHKFDFKHGEILRVSYDLFSTNPYNGVMLKDIAAAVGLNKSQLQNIYARKNDILHDLTKEHTTNSFMYTTHILSNEKDDIKKYSLHCALFWKAVDRNKRLDIFYRNVLNDLELRNILLESIYEWHQERKYQDPNISENVRLMPALVFSISGGLDLFLKKDSVRVDTKFVTDQIIKSFMQILGYQTEYIQEVIDFTGQMMQNIDVGKYLEYCEEKIDWMIL